MSGASTRGGAATVGSIFDEGIWVRLRVPQRDDPMMRTSAGFATGFSQLTSELACHSRICKTQSLREATEARSTEFRAGRPLTHLLRPGGCGELREATNGYQRLPGGYVAYGSGGGKSSK